MLNKALACAAIGFSGLLLQGCPAGDGQDADSTRASKTPRVEDNTSSEKDTNTEDDAPITVHFYSLQIFNEMFLLSRTVFNFLNFVNIQTAANPQDGSAEPITTSSTPTEKKEGKDGKKSGSNAGSSSTTDTPKTDAEDEEDEPFFYFSSPSKKPAPEQRDPNIPKSINLGIPQSGNSCYAASTLQGLRSINFLEFLNINSVSKEESQHKIGKALIDLFETLPSAAKSAQEVHEQMDIALQPCMAESDGKTTKPRFRAGKQEDPEEFLTAIADGLLRERIHQVDGIRRQEWEQVKGYFKAVTPKQEGKFPSSYDKNVEDDFEKCGDGVCFKEAPTNFNTRFWKKRKILTVRLHPVEFFPDIHEIKTLDDLKALCDDSKKCTQLKSAVFTSDQRGDDPKFLEHVIIDEPGVERGALHPDGLRAKCYGSSCEKWKITSLSPVDSDTNAITQTVTVTSFDSLQEKWSAHCVESDCVLGLQAHAYVTQQSTGFKYPWSYVRVVSPKCSICGQVKPEDIDGVVQNCFCISPPNRAENHGNRIGVDMMRLVLQEQVTKLLNDEDGDSDGSRNQRCRDVTCKQTHAARYEALDAAQKEDGPKHEFVYAGFEPPDAPVIQLKIYETRGGGASGETFSKRKYKADELKVELAQELTYTFVNKKYTWQLNGVVYHRGFTMDAGHYIAFTRRNSIHIDENKKDPSGKYFAKDILHQEWVKWDDATATPSATHDEIMKENNLPGRSPVQPYLAFYKLIRAEDVPTQLGNPQGF